MPCIGVLAVQGAFAAHVAVLARLGHKTREVRAPHDLPGLDGLVLPGGESSVQLKLIDTLGLRAGIASLCREKPVLATCAGMILLAREVRDPRQDSLGLLDVTVARNAWGRQVESFEAQSERGRPLVLIRAPRIIEVSPEVEILDRLAGEPVALRQRGIVALTFHPELTRDASLYELAFTARHAATLTAPT